MMKFATCILALALAASTRPAGAFAPPNSARAPRSPALCASEGDESAFVADVDADEADAAFDAVEKMGRGAAKVSPRAATGRGRVATVAARERRGRRGVRVGGSAGARAGRAGECVRVDLCDKPSRNDLLALRLPAASVAIACVSPSANCTGQSATAQHLELDLSPPWGNSAS